MGLKEVLEGGLRELEAWEEDLLSFGLFVAQLVLLLVGRRCLNCSEI